MLVAGYPCVSLSSLNVAPAAFSDSSSATGAGFTAVTGFIRFAKPELVALENVRQMLQKRKPDGGIRPIDRQNALMLSLGYQTGFILANSCLFGLPQSRNRCWMLYIRSDKSKADAGDLEKDLMWFGLTKCHFGRASVSLFFFFWGHRKWNNAQPVR